VDKVELLALGRSIDDVLVDHDIEPTVVLNWLLEEGLIKLEEYFEEDNE
jgi:hypothetical protein